MSDSIIIARDLAESDITVAEAARADGGLILPADPGDEPETTLSDWSDQ